MSESSSFSILHTSCSFEHVIVQRNVTSNFNEVLENKNVTLQHAYLARGFTDLLGQSRKVAEGSVLQVTRTRRKAK